MKNSTGDLHDGEDDQQQQMDDNEVFDNCTSSFFPFTDFRGSPIRAQQR